MFPTRRMVVLSVGLLVFATTAARPAFAQSTTPFHLHSEDSGDFCCYALKTTGPDVPSSVIVQSGDLKNHGTEHGSLRMFKTLAGVPNWYGAIASGSTITFRMWMKKTSANGVVYPEASVRLNDGSGALFCQATGVASATPPDSPPNQALTTTLTEYVFHCITTAAVNVTTTDRLWLTAGYYLGTGPGNHSMKVELDYEGSAASPVPDSRVIVPNAVPPTPTITGFNYASAPPNTVVHITGTNFGDANVTRSVTFNGTTAATTNWTSTAVDATVPAGLAPGPSPALVPVPVTAIVQGVSSAAVTFSINPPPTLTSLTPSTAHTTDVITIAGQNFLATQAQGSSTVTFNSVSASPTTWSNTTIQVPVPAGQTSGSVVVTVAGRSSSGLPFTLIPPPAVTALYPTSGQVGATVTIIGQRFGATQGTSTVAFHGANATPTQWSDTVIKASVPAGATTGPVVVKVSNQPSPDVTFTVVAAGSVSGAITKVTGGTPLSGATVQAVLTGVVKGTATSAADGTYSIGNLDPGTYDIRVLATGYSSEVRSGTVISAGATTTVNVAMLQPGSISGTVTQSDGVTPISGAAVTLYSGSFQKGSASTGGSGAYSITNLHPGAYTVRAADVGFRTKEQGASITENTNTTSNLSLDAPGTAGVSYVYDELGRLVQVTDPSGDSAIYRYDLVGNITSIERPGATTVSLSEFTPNSGPVGTTVTIDGTGFSTTPSSNTVTFGGTAATVTAAAATQLTVTAPAAGQIGVSTPNGSANSGTASFTITTTGPPTITSFSPTTAASGASLTVNGTNFDTVPANDNLSVNVTPAQVSSATATALQATAPAATTTGHLSVATVNGTVTSTDYLWIAPPPYVAANLDSTGTLPFATATPITVAASADSSKIALRVFDGTQGHRASVKVSGVSASFNAYLYDAFGNIMQSATTILDNSLIDVVTLRSTATYSVVLDPQTTNQASATVTVYDVPADFTSTITPGATNAVTVSISTPGQNGKLTFSGTAGQKMSLQGTNGTIHQQILGCDVNVSILNPDGSVLAPATCMEDSGFIDATLLPTTGTYTILVDPVSFATGNLTLTLYTVTDFSGSLTPTTSGSSLTVQLPTPGQNGVVTFSGTAQQRVSLEGTNGTIFGQIIGCDVNVSIVRASDGLVVAAATCMEGSGFIDVTTLPTTDTYNIVVDPVGTATGNLTLTLYDVPADQAGSLNVNDPATPVSLQTPGQNGSYTFTLSSTQLVTVRITNNSIAGTSPCVNVSLMNGATTIASSGSCGGSFNLTQQSLGAGTYTVKIDPVGNSKGTISIQVTSP